jgi:hypothetical protein
MLAPKVIGKSEKRSQSLASVMGSNASGRSAYRPAESPLWPEFAYANLLQPEIDIELPTQKTIMSWDPPNSFFLNSRAENKLPPERDYADAPVIVFENKSSIIGQDASIAWEISQYDVKSLVESSARLKNYDVTFTQDSILIGPRSPIAMPTGLPTRYNKIFRQNVPPLAFLGKRVESWIPAGLWTQAMIYFLATLPEQPGGQSPPVIFTVTAKWNIPENGKPARFKVTAIAANANTPGLETPKLSASVSLSAEKLKD